MTRGEVSRMRSTLLPRLLIGLALLLCAALPFLAAGCSDNNACDTDCPDAPMVLHDLSGDLAKNVDLGEVD